MTIIIFLRDVSISNIERIDNVTRFYNENNNLYVLTLGRIFKCQLNEISHFQVIP